jgi:chromosome partitioning protein
VGKTTTAINLAASLAIMEKHVLLVDCDPQANSTSGLGIAQETLSASLYTALYRPEEAFDAIVSISGEFLSLLPSTTDLVGVELELVDKMAREFYLRDALTPLFSSYDYILLDCPPSLGLLTLNALCAARELLIPLQCEFFALEGIVRLLDTYEQVKKRLNPQLMLLGVVLTMYDMRNNLTRDVKNEVRKCFPEHLFDTVIPRNVRLSEAPSHGLSVIHYDIKSRGAEAYLGLAKEVVLRKPPAKKVERSAPAR